jgi:hypothetical protein
VSVTAPVAKAPVENPRALVITLPMSQSSSNSPTLPHTEALMKPIYIAKISRWIEKMKATTLHRAPAAVFAKLGSDKAELNACATTGSR